MPVFFFDLADHSDAELQEPHRMPTAVLWHCPTCGKQVADIFAETAMPMCDHCERIVHWEDVLPRSAFEILNHDLLGK